MSFLIFCPDSGKAMVPGHNLGVALLKRAPNKITPSHLDVLGWSVIRGRHTAMWLQQEASKGTLFTRTTWDGEGIAHYFTLASSPLFGEEQIPLYQWRGMQLWEELFCTGTTAIWHFVTNIKARKELFNEVASIFDCYVIRERRWPFERVTTHAATSDDGLVPGLSEPEVFWRSVALGRDSL